MKVLIVEDEIFAALHLEAAITKLGCRVIGIAPDSESALKLAEGQPELAFVDLNLRDGLKGPEIGRRLADQYGTKVLILTGNPTQAGEAFDGLLGVVPKPWTEDDIAETVEAARKTEG